MEHQVERRLSIVRAELDHFELVSAVLQVVPMDRPLFVPRRFRLEREIAITARARTHTRVRPFFFFERKKKTNIKEYRSLGTRGNKNRRHRLDWRGACPAFQSFTPRK